MTSVKDVYIFLIDILLIKYGAGIVKVTRKIVMSCITSHFSALLIAMSKVKCKEKFELLSQSFKFFFFLYGRGYLINLTS